MAAGINCSPLPGDHSVGVTATLCTITKLSAANGARKKQLKTKQKDTMKAAHTKFLRS